MTNNPLIEKFYELHPEKKEKPKFPRPEDYKGEKTIADELKELSTSSVASSNTGITKANPIPKLTSYDVDSVKDSFLQIAEKVKNGDARVTYVTMNTGNFIRSITFEVQVYDAP